MMVDVEYGPIFRALFKETAQERTSKFPVAHREVFRARHLETDFPSVPIGHNLEVMDCESRVD